MATTFDNDSPEIEDELSAGGLSDKLHRWSVNVFRTDRSVHDLHHRWMEGDLNAQPEFQRGLVWDLRQQSAFVETVLLRLPIPVVYALEERDGRLQVIDGQQRLMALFRYRQDEFALEDLQILAELNGRHFRDLDRRMQRRFEDTVVPVSIIEASADPAVRYELFLRLNTTGLPRTAQELRSYLMSGPGVHLLQRLAADGSAFRAIAGEHRSFQRMRAEELVLRCLAFLDLGVDRYHGDMQGFLTEELKRLNVQSDGERTALVARFEAILSALLDICGSNAFRRKDHAGLNTALMDVLVAGFLDEPPLAFWTANKKLVLAALNEVLRSPDFVDAISHSTASVRQVQRRFDLWKKALKNAANHFS